MAKDGAGAGMDKGGLRKMLRMAVKQPVHAAFALGADGKAIVHLDKAKQPRSLEKIIKDSAPDSKGHRFGSVTVDPDEPTLARFMVNKASASMAKKLIIALKGTGFRKVLIVLEDGSPVETAESEEDEEDVQDHDDDRVDDDRADDDRADDEDTDRKGSTQAAADSDGGTAEESKPDANELTRTLTGLVKRMIGVIAKDPKQKTALAELATDAQASLKRGDLEQAAAGIEILKTALESSGGDKPVTAGEDNPFAAPPKEHHAGKEAGQDVSEDTKDAGGNAAPAAHDDAGHDDAGHNEAAHHKHRAAKANKSRSAWMATRSKIEGDIKKLKAEILSATDGAGMGEDLEKSFHSAVDPVLQTLDDKLAHVLDAAAKAEQREEHDKQIAEAHRIIAHYTKFIGSNEIIAKLDTNPFMPMQVGKTLSLTLGTLASALR